MNYDSPAQVQHRLAEIAERMAHLSNEWAHAVRLQAEAKARYELAMARQRATLKEEPLTVDQRHDKALLAVEEGTSLITSLAAAEGAVEGHKAAFKVLDRESSNLQSLLAGMKAEIATGSVL